jgi:hypothetical protein
VGRIIHIGHFYLRGEIQETIREKSGKCETSRKKEGKGEKLKLRVKINPKEAKIRLKVCVRSKN